MKSVRFEPQKREEYKKVDQAIRKEMTKAKENWLQQKWDKIEKEQSKDTAKKYSKK